MIKGAQTVQIMERAEEFHVLICKLSEAEAAGSLTWLTVEPITGLLRRTPHWT
jgi:hypothetical protein